MYQQNNQNNQNNQVNQIPGEQQHLIHQEPYVPQRLLNTANSLNNIILDQLKGSDVLLACVVILMAFALSITIVYLATVVTGGGFETGFLALCFFTAIIITYVLAGLVRDSGRRTIIDKHNENKDVEISKLLGKWNTNLRVRTILVGISLLLVIGAFVAAVVKIQFDNATGDRVSAVIIEILLIGSTFMFTYVVQNRLDASQWTEHMKEINKIPNNINNV